MFFAFSSVFYLVAGLYFISGVQTVVASPIRIAPALLKELSLDLARRRCGHVCMWLVPQGESTGSVSSVPTHTLDAESNQLLTVIHTVSVMPTEDIPEIILTGTPSSTRISVPVTTPISPVNLGASPSLPPPEEISSPAPLADPDYFPYPRPTTNGDVLKNLANPLTVFVAFLTWISLSFIF